MKNLTWQQWTAIGIIAAVVITGVVLHFVQPQVSYALTEAMTICAFIVGGITGYMLKKKNIINDGDKQSKTQVINDATATPLEPAPADEVKRTRTTKKA